MRFKGKVACALALAAVPFVIDPGVAGAAVRTDTKTGSLTFISTTGVSTTCAFTATATHNTDANPDVLRMSSESPCRGSMRITFTYKDENGVNQGGTSFAGSARNLETSVGHAVSSIAVTHSIQFTGCDVAANPTCSLVLHTAPK